MLIDCDVHVSPWPRQGLRPVQRYAARAEGDELVVSLDAPAG
jgi:hypothetical protein